MDRSPQVMRTHLHAYARCIYIHEFRTGIGLRVYRPSCPSWMPHAFPVRQASALPTASFGFRLTTDTLAVRLTVPPVGPVEDSHLRVGAPCRAHRKKSPSRCPPRGARLNRVEKPTVHTRTCLPEVRRLRGRARSVSAQGLYFAWSQRDYTEKDEPSSQDMQQDKRQFAGQRTRTRGNVRYRGFARHGSARTPDGLLH